MKPLVIEHKACNLVNESYVYDALGKRIVKSDLSGDVIYTYLGEQLLSEYDPTGGIFTDSVFMGGQLLAKVIDDGVSFTDVSYAHLNHLGSPVAFTDGTAAVVWPEQVGGTPYEVHAYEPFGADFDDIGTPTEENKIRYTGKLFESETGKHYFNVRYLNAVTDAANPELPPRFLSPDVVLGNPGNGQSWNRYTSMANNPVKYVDPDGLEVAFALKGTPGYMNQANRDKLRTELSQITGWSVNDIEIKNNILTVKPSAQATGGSKEARKRLKEFIDDPYKVVVYDASGDNTVLFGQGSQRRDSSAGGQIQLDFSDFGNITYHNVEKLSYDVGMTFFHEGGHAFLDYVDPNSNKRGRTCHRWVDKIRGQLKLTKRRNYEAHPTGSGTNRLEFKGRDKYIEW